MLNTSEEYVKQYFTGDNTIPELGDAMSAVVKYAAQAQSYSYQSKRDRVWEFYQSIQEHTIVELVLKIFTATLMNKRLTMPALVGMMNHLMPHDDKLDRAKTIAEIIAVIGETELILLTKKSTYEGVNIQPGYSIDEEIPVEDKHELSQYPAQHIDSNRDDIEGSMIMGGSLTHHEEEICLRHLNDMNRIELTLNEPLLRAYKEMPTFELNTPDKTEQWNKFRLDSLWKYVEVVRDKNNKLYLRHKCDTRGRTYAVGYHVSTQGTSYKKAILQLANKEMVKDEII